MHRMVIPSVVNLSRGHPQSQELAIPAPMPVHALSLGDKTSDAPICSPTQPDIWLTVNQPPSLDKLCCTACGARGSPHLAYQQSNAAKWGSHFFWVYCQLCLAAFGTLIGNVLRTYVAVPKENSATARAERQRGVNATRQPVITAPTTPTTPIKAAETIQKFFTPRRTVQNCRPGISNTSSRPMAQSQSSALAAPTGPSSAPMPSSALLSLDSRGADCDGDKDGPSDVGWDGGWEVPESPIKPKRKRPDRRNMEITVQLLSCKEYSLPLQVEDNVLRWNDLPELIRSHLQSQITARALELRVGGGVWTPFGFATSIGLDASERIFARVVSGKPVSPHEPCAGGQVIVLADDSSEEEQLPLKRRRSGAKEKVTAEAASGSRVGPATRARRK